MWRLPPWLPPDGPNAPLFRALEAALPLEAPQAPGEVLDVYRAEGGWLDLHGETYGIPRLPDEADDAYRQRILALFAPRLTLEAIRRGLALAYGAAQVEEFPEGYRQTLWEVPVADGSVDAGLDYWPPTPEDPGAARIHVRLPGGTLPPRGRDPVLETLRAAGVLPSLEVPVVGTPARGRHERGEWGFTGATATGAWEADGYLGFAVLPEATPSETFLTSAFLSSPVADGSLTAGGER